VQLVGIVEEEEDVTRKTSRGRRSRDGPVTK
jgi:hypothetical protein